jgi:hypothetical protein
MRRHQGTHRLRAGLLAMLLITGGPLAAAHADTTPSGLAADHVIACLKTAVAAQAGLVTDVEVEYERGQWRCEVTLVEETGKRPTLHIDGATNQVAKAT